MSTELNKPQKSFLLPFFLLTFFLTWGIGAFAIILPEQARALFGEVTDTSPIYYLAVAAPTISATVMTLVQSGWPGLKTLYARLIQWRIGLKWYVLVLVGFPAIGWLASLIAGSTPLKVWSNSTQFFYLLLSLLISGPLGEELGWRGFALPRLLKRFSPLAASLILGAIWGIWHLPSFFVSGMVQTGFSLPAFLLFTPALAILITWIFQHTGGSVLISVLIHYMVNICASIFGVTLPTLGVIMLVASVLIITLDKGFGWPHPLKLLRPVIELK